MGRQLFTQQSLCGVHLLRGKPHLCKVNNDLLAQRLPGEPLVKLVCVLGRGVHHHLGRLRALKVAVDFRLRGARDTVGSNVATPVAGAEQQRIRRRTFQHQPLRRPA